MGKNSFKASEPYPVTPPGNGNGVNKLQWTRSQRDVDASQSGFMGVRDTRRRNPERIRQNDNPLIRQLIDGVGGPRHGKTSAQTNPPYSIRSSKPIVRRAVKAWRKGILKENARGVS